MACLISGGNFHGRTHNNKCDNQPIIIDNFGVCGGVGAHSRSVRQSIRSRATRSGGGSSSSQKPCPPCVAGQSVLNSCGSYNCNTRSLTRKEEKDNLIKMFPVTRPIYIRRPNNWFIYRR